MGWFLEGPHSWLLVAGWKLSTKHPKQTLTWSWDVYIYASHDAEIFKLRCVWSDVALQLWVRFFQSLLCFLGGGGNLSCRTPVGTTSRQSWPWVDRTLSRTAVNRVMLGNLCHALVLKFWIELEEVWVTTLQSPQSTTHHMVLYSPHMLLATDQDPCWWVHMAKVHINFFRRKHRIWMAQSSGEKTLFWDNDVLVLSTS